MIPPSPFPVDRFSSAFDALVDVLREDPALKRAVKTWRTWEGETADATPPEQREMPWLRLTPTLSAIQFDSVNSYRVDLVIAAEMAVRGTNVRHVLHFWGAIMDALIDEKPHRDRTVRKFLQDNHVTHYRVLRVGAAPVRYPPPSKDLPLGGSDLTAQGAIDLSVYVDA